MAKDKRTAFQKIGGHTLIPYVLDSAGYPDAATFTGYPRHLEEERQERMKKKKKPQKKKHGGRVRGDGCAVRGKTKGTIR